MTVGKCFQRALGLQSARRECERVGPRREHKPAMLTVLLALLFMYQADATIVNVAMPSIRANLRASPAQLQLVTGGYLLASASLLITGARLGHIHGPKRVFLFGVAVFGAASLACGVATDPSLLIVARVIQGIGGALAFPQVLTSIQRTFEDGPQRARALGWYSLALAGGAVVGQLLGGLLVSADVLSLQWRPIFLVNVPIAVAVTLSGLRYLPVELLSANSTRLDVLGAATLSSAVLLIVLPLTLGESAGWPAWTWICMTASLPIFGVFILIERRHSGHGRIPLVNLALTGRPAIAWGLWTQAMAVATYYALLFTIALYLQGGLGRSALVSGLTLLPWVVAFGVPGRLIPRLPRRVEHMLPAAGCVMLALSYAVISLTMLVGEHPETLLPVLLAFGGLGLGTVFSSVLANLTAAATPRYAADISGIFTTVMQIAGALGIAIFGALYLSRVTHPGATEATHAFGVVTAVFAVVALIAAAAGYRATHSPIPTEHPKRPLAETRSHSVRYSNPAGSWSGCETRAQSPVGARGVR